MSKVTLATRSLVFPDSKKGIKGNYRSYIKAMVDGDIKLRDMVQYYIMQGMIHYDEHHNSNPLSELLNADIKGVRTAAIQEYIQDHTDLVWMKDKNTGLSRFLREALIGFEFKIPEKTWYDYSNAGTAIPVIDPDKMIASLKATLKAVLKGEGKKVLKHGSEERAKQILAAVEAI